MSGSIQMIGDWRTNMNLRMKDALAVTMAVSGRSLAEACKHAIILMAQSAAALTKQSKKKRRVKREKGLEYVETYKKDGSISKLFKFKFDERADDVRGTWEQAQIIKGRGLAKRSWMWGLKSLSKKMTTGRPIRGVGYLYKILTAKVGGFVLKNNLHYITKALPPGWKQQVERSAAKKSMKQSENKLKRDWARAVQRTGGRGGSTKPDMAKYIRRVA